MSAILDALHDASLITAFDREFARAMSRVAGESRPEALAAVALASRETNEGHTCLSFESVVDREEWRNLADEFSLPDAASWRALLGASPLVERIGLDVPVVPDSEPPSNASRPLVLDLEGRLYLRRYWVFQNRLAGNLLARAAVSIESLDEPLLADGLDRLFGRLAASVPGTPAQDESQLSLALDGTPELDRQRLAAAVAVARNFSVISGGPGTGKTATAGKILALIVEQALAREPDSASSDQAPMRIAMVAPTGKAAATLSRSMKRVVESLDCSARVKDAIPTTALTIHRCLGVRGGAMPMFRHDARNPLSIDTLLVDEASMVDLALMTRLLSAVPEHARVILLGDEYQLASVEAGAVLGDICAAAAPGGYSPRFAERLRAWVGDDVDVASDAAEASDVRDSIVRLTRSYRYDEASGIGALARAINGGDSRSALEILESPRYPDVVRVEFASRGEPLATLHREWIDGFGEYLSEADPERMLGRFSHFRVLTPQRAGPGGVEALNRQIEAVLRHARLLRGRADRYAGRPLMIRSNDYAQSLWNGDVGIVLGGEPGVERVVFDAPSGDRSAIRTLAFARLPDCETAFAMTIHKSQGSEFDRVAVVLADGAKERATRELLYTAVTRARNHVTLYGSRETIAEAIDRKIQRSSGLGDALRSRIQDR